MKPWDAYLDTSIKATYLNSYLIHRNHMDMYKAKKHVANLNARVQSDLNKQLNAQKIREAQGLHGFELALQDFYAQLAQHRNNGNALRPLIDDYLQFLKLREALGLITFDVPNTAKLEDKARELSETDMFFMRDGKLLFIGNPSCAAKMKPYVTGPVINAECGARAAAEFYEGLIRMTDEEWLSVTNKLIEAIGFKPTGCRNTHYKLTTIDGKEYILSPLEALIRVVTEVGPERVFEKKILAKTDMPLVINIIYPNQKAYYKRMGQTRYWLYSKAGRENIKLINKILLAIPDSPFTSVEMA